MLNAPEYGGFRFDRWFSRPTDLEGRLAGVSNVLAPLFAGLLATPLGQLLLTLVALAVVVLVGRLILSLAWRVLTIAIVVVAVLYVFGVLF